jgi:hypothetical protein
MVSQNIKSGGKAKMLFRKNIPFLKYWRLRGIAKQVRAGSIPKGVDQQTIFEALRVTRPRAAVEFFGLLYAKVFHPDGTLKRDYGLVSVREVSAAFAKRLVDCLTTSGDALEDFKYHKQGSGSTAETDTETALVAAQSGAILGTQTHGTSSQIYHSVGTITAMTAYGCREHGVFNASTGGILLDRSVVTNIDLNTDDIVTWTYDLTCNAGG